MFENFFSGVIHIIISLSAGVLGVIPGIEGHDAKFSTFEFNVVEDCILISAKIEDELNPRIDDIIKSGRPVRLKILAECYLAAQDKGPLHQRSLLKSVRYNLLKKQYEIETGNSREKLIFKENQEMWKAFLNIRDQFIFTSGDFLEEGKYYIKVTARLETELEISGRKLDLMLFWNNNPPVAMTGLFDKTIFMF
ncbi:MAG: DUF4390 domain-containing protein [Candidatus Marinimicrobia bacterium]|nr:DUF4390 domain-containing protein [Candidatus Neomarinimicrobiota bacterium]